MNRDQVLQHLNQLYQCSRILDPDIRVALGYAMIELSGEGRAEMPKKARETLDHIEQETNRRMQMRHGQKVLDVME